MQVAKIEYEVTGDEPINILEGLLSRISISRDNEGYVENGRALINMRNEIEHDRINSYRSAAKSFRNGGVNMKEVAFPLRIGNISYIDTIPASNQLVILFRHDSCIANNYADEYDEDNDEHTGEMIEHATHHQPQFYFTVLIDTTNGTKQYRIVQAPWAVNGRMFPHNSSNRDNVYSSNCAGGYGNQLNEGLRQDNLGVFLSVFSDYIMNGTRINDEYGRSYDYFTNHAKPRNSNIHVNDLVQGKIMGHVMSDPEHPFEYNMESQVRSLTFTNPAVENIFYDTLCRGREVKT